MNKFVISPNGISTPFPHYWERCVGSCHAVTALRDDWRQQLRRTRAELGFDYIRFHGLLDDAMSVVVEDSWRKQIHYSFFNVDRVFDFLLEIGMKPVVELGFMPTALASGQSTCFHYRANITPPNNFERWEDLIGRLGRHLVERYGLEEVRTWYFEVWNEPNLPFFWAGTQEEYFRLYHHSARALKAVDPLLRVGGPATSVNAWIPEMLAFCRETETPIDFVSTHHYPTDDPLWRDPSLGMEEFLKFAGHYERGILATMTKRAREQSGGLPLFYTEWNTSAIFGEDQHDEPYAAALVVKTLADNDGLVEMYSFWTFSDIFEEGGQRGLPFHGGFGLQTIHGIPKPTYRAFQFLHSLGTERLTVERVTPPSTAEVLVTRKDRQLLMLVHNHDVPGAELRAQNIQILLSGVQDAVATMQMLDQTHGNAKSVWLELGSPEYLDAAQIAQIEKGSRLVVETLKGEADSEGWRFSLTLEPHGVALVIVHLC